MEKEYDIIEIKGKHGMIHLHVPKREATQDEVRHLHDTVARALVNNSKNGDKPTKT